MAQFSPEMTAQLARPEGTITFRHTLSTPIGKPPKQPAALLETPPGSAHLARLEVNPQLEMSFLHAPAGDKPRIARVDLEPLRGCAAIQIYLTWSADEVRLHVGARDQKIELLGGSSTDA